MKKKIAIITGASSGIGQEFAFQLDEIMHELDEIWLIARRRERLEELAKVLETGCRTIAMDVTEERDMELFRKLREDIISAAMDDITTSYNPRKVTKADLSVLLDRLAG